MIRRSGAVAPDDYKDWQQVFSDMVYWKVEGTLADHHVVSGVGFMERALELKPRDKVLDLGCALGQHSIELARRGYDVTGLEYSRTFLEVAKERIQEAGASVRLVQGDMTQLAFEDEFDAAILWGNTFGMFADEDNRRTLEGIRRALKLGGRALIDTQNYTTLGGERRQEWAFHEDDPNLLLLTEGTRDTLRARFGFNVLAINLATGKRHLMPFSWRLYLLPELAHMVADAGLTLLGVYGDDPAKVDWKSWRRGEPEPYSTDGFTEKAAKRILLCEREQHGAQRRTTSASRGEDAGLESTWARLRLDGAESGDLRLRLAKESDLMAVLEMLLHPSTLAALGETPCPCHIALGPVSRPELLSISFGVGNGSGAT